MKNPISNPMCLDAFEHLLRASIRVLKVSESHFPPGWKTSDATVISHRLLNIEQGSIDYTVEGVDRRLIKGMWVFVPEWSRREWRTPQRGGGCHLLWCEFSGGEMELPAAWWQSGGREGKEFETIKTALRVGGRRGLLLAEARVKSTMAQFWPKAQPWFPDGVQKKSGAHPEVRRARAWLRTHFTEVDALDRFYGTVDMCPNYFRLLFRRDTGETVQKVLARLRLRRARWLVRSTSWPMKRIAFESGFSDPLYFSRCYRDFWGCPPSADRVDCDIA